MEREYPVPGWDKYTVTETGIVYSYQRGSRKQLKPAKSKKRRPDPYVVLHRKNQFGETVAKYAYVHRVVCSAKVKRELHDWEHVRHMDGNHKNNHMSNLEVGCALLNTIDDLEIGKRQTSLEYIEEAMQRLSNLKAVYEKEPPR